MSKNLSDQADILAELSGIKTKIQATGISLEDLISQHASMAAEKANVNGEVAKLTGDKSKLVAGANLPSDLVAAANDLFAANQEIANLKAAAKTVDEAAAAKVVALGIVGGKTAEKGNDKAEKPKTLTEKVLEAKGFKTLAEAAEKFEASAANLN